MSAQHPAPRRPWHRQRRLRDFRLWRDSYRFPRHLSADKLEYWSSRRAQHTELFAAINMRDFNDYCAHYAIYYRLERHGA